MPLLDPVSPAFATVRTTGGVVPSYTQRRKVGAAFNNTPSSPLGSSGFAPRSLPGRPRASQDLAKTLQAKAGTQGAFMLRCCGIVAAASRILNSDIGNEVVAILSAISRVPPEDIATYAGEITAHVGPEF